MECVVQVEMADRAEKKITFISTEVIDMFGFLDQFSYLQLHPLQKE